MAIELFTTQPAYWDSFLWDTTAWDAAGDAYALPASLTLRVDDLDMRYQSADRMLGHGESTNGHFAKGKTLEVKGVIMSDSTDEELTLTREIAQMAVKPNLLMRYRSDCYIPVILRKRDASPLELSNHEVHNFGLSFYAPSPFWRANASEQHTEILTGDATFTVSVDTSVYPDVVPVITIEAPTVGTVTTWRLENTTDDERFLTYADPSLKNGAVTTLDCSAATASRAGTNTIRYKGGRWLRLLAGDNEFTYTGSACTITITWTPRWL